MVHLLFLKLGFTLANIFFVADGNVMISSTLKLTRQYIQYVAKLFYEIISMN